MEEEDTDQKRDFVEEKLFETKETFHSMKKPNQTTDENNNKDFFNSKIAQPKIEMNNDLSNLKIPQKNIKFDEFEIKKMRNHKETNSSFGKESFSTPKNIGGSPNAQNGTQTQTILLSQIKDPKIKQFFTKSQIIPAFNDSNYNNFSKKLNITEKIDSSFPQLS